jgi:hypothetical protein
MKLFSALLFSTALCLGACSKSVSSVTPQTGGAQAVSPLGAKIAKTQSRSNGMVAAANPLATQAGVDILKAGGSAIDAKSGPIMAARQRQAPRLINYLSTQKRASLCAVLQVSPLAFQRAFRAL